MRDARPRPASARSRRRARFGLGRGKPGAARDYAERDDPGDQRQERRARFGLGRLLGGLRLCHRLRLGGDAYLKRVNPDRPFDVLELGLAEIGDLHIEPPPHLPISVLGQADRAGLGDPLQSRGDIDAVAHQVAVGLLDHIAEMDADPEFYAALRRQARVALDHAALHFDRAAHRVDHAAELDEGAVTGALDDATVMHGDGGINQVAAQRPKSRQGAILVCPREPAVSDDIRDQNRCDLPGLAHGARLRVSCGIAQKACQSAGYKCEERAKGGRPRQYSNGGFSLGSTRSPHRLAMTAICAQPSPRGPP